LKDTFSAGVHGSTFGGNPIAMAAAKATLEIIFQPDFLQNVQEKGTYFLAKLQEELGELEFVKEVRGLGLLVGIECHGEIAHLLPAIHEKGLLVLSAGPNVVRLLPPLIVTKEQLDQAVQIVKQTMQKAGVAAAK
jgi:acetylornithine/N-succinyldiaminopimelate aminotransferase